MSDRERLHPSLCNTLLCCLYLKIRSEEGRCFLLKPVNSRAQPLLILSPSSDLISFQFLTFCYTETQESSYKVLSCRLENHPPTPHRTAQCHKLSWLLRPTASGLHLSEFPGERWTTFPMRRTKTKEDLQLCMCSPPLPPRYTALVSQRSLFQQQCWILITALLTFSPGAS